MDEHEDSSGFYGQCPPQTESKCLTEEQGVTSEEYEIKNTVRKLFQKYDLSNKEKNLPVIKFEKSSL